jgi:hypothetical protein
MSLSQEMETMIIKTTKLDQQDAEKENDGDDDNDDDDDDGGGRGRGGRCGREKKKYVMYQRQLTARSELQKMASPAFVRVFTTDIESRHTTITIASGIFMHTVKKRLRMRLRMLMMLSVSWRKQKDVPTPRARWRSSPY